MAVAYRSNNLYITEVGECIVIQIALYRYRVNVEGWHLSAAKDMH